jgi:hypothetical protein
MPTVEEYAAAVALSAPPPSAEMRTRLAEMLAPVRESIRNARKASPA